MTFNIFLYQYPSSPLLSLAPSFPALTSFYTSSSFSAMLSTNYLISSYFDSRVHEWIGSHWLLGIGPSTISTVSSKSSTGCEKIFKYDGTLSWSFLILLCLIEKGSLSIESRLLLSFKFSKLTLPLSSYRITNENIEFLLLSSDSSYLVHLGTCRRVLPRYFGHSLPIPYLFNLLIIFLSISLV